MKKNIPPEITQEQANKEFENYMISQEKIGEKFQTKQDLGNYLDNINVKKSKRIKSRSILWK